MFRLFVRVSLSASTLLSGVTSEKSGKKAQTWNDSFEYSNDVYEIPSFAADITARAHNYDFFVSYIIQLMDASKSFSVFN